MTTDLCKDCKYCKRNYPVSGFFIPVIGWIVLLCWILTGSSLRYATCTAIVCNEDKVTGKKDFWMCSVERKHGPECGPDGKKFEARR